MTFCEFSHHIIWLDRISSIDQSPGYTLVAAKEGHWLLVEGGTR